MAVSGGASRRADGQEDGTARRRELTVFLLTTLVLIPGAAVAVVGTYGLIVWVLQMFLGPPGPPA